MILQLQSNTQKQLTAVDIELIVRRILDPELAALRSSMEGDKDEAFKVQVIVTLHLAGTCCFQFGLPTFNYFVAEWMSLLILLAAKSTIVC